jgi:hypothetical protein
MTPDIVKVAVTSPPSFWFDGIATAMYELYTRALDDLGLELFDVPVEPFINGDLVAIRALVRQLEAFRPDLAIGLPKGAYALLCRMPPRRNGARLNLFTQVLGIPAVCLWDHAPFDLCDQLLGPFPDSPEQSTAGALDRLRGVLSQPGLVHWSPDRGQTAIMRSLDLVRPEQVLHEWLPALPGFEPDPGQAPAAAGSPRVAFVGHLYQSERERLDTVERLALDVLTAWRASPRPRPFWDVLTERISELSAEERQQLALTTDQTFFWRFAHTLTIRRAQTALRLDRLGAIPAPVACYGNLEIRHDTPSHLMPVPGHIPFGPPLSRVLARHEVTVDVMNPGSVHGYSHKPAMTFASGGFALIDRKAHFLEAFGAVGDAVSYDSKAELADKVGYYLSRPAERRDVGDAIRARLRQKFALTQVLRRVLTAPAVTAAMDRCRQSPMATRDPEGIFVLDLLPHLRAETYWNSTLAETNGGMELKTSEGAWSYAAHVSLPSTLEGLHEPHVRLDVRVETGSLGVAVATGDPWILSGEQFLPPTDGHETLVLELPEQGTASLVLRTGTTSPARVHVASVRLCERARD